MFGYIQFAIERCAVGGSRAICMRRKEHNTLKVLDYEFSERFDKLYDSARKKLKRKITFYPISEHPNEHVHEARGAHYIDETNVSVFINTEELESAEAEVTAAEDIIYSLVRAVDKFPFAMGNTKLDEEKLYEAEAIAGTLTAAIYHLPVLSRLKKRGFWIEIVQKKDIQELIGIFSGPGFQEPPPDSLPFYNLLMRYIETCFYKDMDLEEIKGIYQLKASGIHAAGEMGIEIVKCFGFDTPKKCLNTMIDLRDMLQLNDKVWIMNAETETVF